MRGLITIQDCLFPELREGSMIDHMSLWRVRPVLLIDYAQLVPNRRVF